MLRLNIVLFVFIFCFAAACEANKTSGNDIREPVVAGKFYPESATRLRLAIEKFLHDALPVRMTKPVALIVPHAGYIFSGQICADGFKQVAHHPYDVIVILGTNHTHPNFGKISLFPGGGFRTPLGTAKVDKKIVAELVQTDPAICVLDQSLHEQEHSVEVIVPFVQIVFPRAKIVPVVVGSNDMQTSVRFGQALAKVLKNKRALIITSSDLSHYPSADDAEKVDKQTLDAIAKLDIHHFNSTIKSHSEKGFANFHTSACGEDPIMAAMAAAKSLGATRGEIISYAHSGDVSVGERSRVVGYGAVVLTADSKSKLTGGMDKPLMKSVSDTLTSADKKALLDFARETVSRLFLTDTVPLARGFRPALLQPRGVFVTLKKHGELRGCIGRIIADEPLAKRVGTMAIQAAFNDRRFNQLAPEELKDTEFEISVLTPARRVSGINDIVAGRDGVILSKNGHSAVFLPQVATEQGWNREELLDNLCLKAGLERKSWKEGAQFSTFQAVVFSESQFR